MWCCHRKYPHDIFPWRWDHEEKRPSFRGLPTVAKTAVFFLWHIWGTPVRWTTVSILIFFFIVVILMVKPVTIIPSVTMIQKVAALWHWGYHILESTSAYQLRCGHCNRITCVLPKSTWHSIVFLRMFNIIVNGLVWSGLRETWKRKPWFLDPSMRFSCNRFL